MEKISVNYIGRGIMKDSYGNTYIASSEDDYCHNDVTGERYTMTDFDEDDDPIAIVKV